MTITPTKNRDKNCLRHRFDTDHSGTRSSWSLGDTTRTANPKPSPGKNLIPID